MGPAAHYNLYSYEEFFLLPTPRLSVFFTMGSRPPRLAFMFSSSDEDCPASQPRIFTSSVHVASGSDSQNSHNLGFHLWAMPDLMLRSIIPVMGGSPFHRLSSGGEMSTRVADVWTEFGFRRFPPELGQWAFVHLGRHLEKLW